MRIEFGNARLEQFVARKGFENVLQRLAVVAVGRQREVLRPPARLCGAAAESRAGCCCRPTEVHRPKKAPLADQAALGVEVLDADVVEVARRGAPSIAGSPW